MLEAVSEPPLMQRQFPSIHFSLVSSNEERNIRRGSRATPLRHPLLHTLLLFSRSTNFSSSPTSTSSLESNSNFRKFKDSENLLLPNNWERWAFIFVYIRNEASPTFFEFAGRTAFATGVFLFRALNFRAVRRHARRGWPGCKIKTEQRYVKFLRGRTTVLRPAAANPGKTLLSPPSLSFSVGLLLLRDISGVCRGKRASEEHVGGGLPRARREAWQEMSHASEGITTREGLAFQRWHVLRARQREREEEPRKIFTPPGRNIGRRRRRRVTREHPVNSSRGNRVTRLDDRPREREREREKRDDPEFARRGRQFFTVITRV